MQVENTGGLDVITKDCLVVMHAKGKHSSELQLGDGTDLLFFCEDDDPCDTAENPDGFKYFAIIGFGSGSDSEIQIEIKKNSVFEASNLTVMVAADGTDLQIEENLCLRLHGHLMLSNLGGDEGDLWFKKFEADKVFVEFTDRECPAPEASPNIIVDGDIEIEVGEKDGLIQIEEFNEMEAGGSITLTGNAGQIQMKKEIVLTAGSSTGNIKLSAAGDKGEVHIGDDNDYDATGDITVEAGPGGKTEIKKESVFLAGGDITVTSGGDCKVEDPVALDPDGDGVICP